MCILDVYSKIAHPFVMQYLVYFLASLTSLNAILLFKMCIRFKHRKDLQHVGSECHRFALSCEGLFNFIIICCQIQSHHLVMLLHLMLIHNHHLLQRRSHGFSCCI